MPQRKAIRHVATPEVQGEDSWVEVRRLQLGEWLALQANGTEMTAAASTQQGLDVLAAHVVAWNWVDDDGNPLPQLSADRTVLEKLTDEEVLCLMRVLQGPGEAQLKN